MATAEVRAAIEVARAAEGRGDRRAAIAALTALLPVASTAAPLQYELGRLYQDLGEDAPSLAAYRAAATAGLEHPALFNNLAGLFVRGRHFVEAERWVRRALALQPDYPAALTNLGLILCNQGRAEEALPALRQAVELDPSLEESWHNLLFQLHYTAEPPEAIAQAHRQYGLRFPSRPRPDIADRDPERRLRVGILSSDLRQHSVARFIAPFLAGADRDRLSLAVYSNARREDGVSAQLAQFLADRGEPWTQVAELSDVDLAARIAADATDVLLELNGHTHGSRLPVLALRPTPLQVTWLGYPNTTGLTSVDLRVTDGWADPDPETGAAALWQAERLARLPGGFLAFSPPSEAPEPQLPPERADGRVTFGSFNALTKLGPHALALWRGVLAAVPHSVLFVKAFGLDDAETRAAVQRQVERAGLPLARVALVGPTPNATAHLSAYQAVHVALDTFPYQGTTTTCEALWMGVPVVARLGSAHVSRVAASLLHQAGLSDLAVASDEAYVAAAARLAGDRPRLARLRQELRPRLAQAPLVDGRRLAGELEAELRAAWRQLVAR